MKDKYAICLYFQVLRTWIILTKFLTPGENVALNTECCLHTLIIVSQCWIDVIMYVSLLYARFSLLVTVSTDINVFRHKTVLAHSLYKQPVNYFVFTSVKKTTLALWVNYTPDNSCFFFKEISCALINSTCVGFCLLFKINNLSW